MLVAVGIAYWPAISAGFIWDDDTAITANPLLKTARGLWMIWSQPALSPQGYYWPVTNTAFWVQYQLWGQHPLGYHLTNIALHAANALLVWALLNRWSVRWAWGAAALFALHPVNVESVAWAVEQKNTLSLLWMLLATHACLRHESRPRARVYAGALALFTAALLSKSSAIVLPPILAVLMWWRAGRLSKTHCLRLAPFFLLALVLGAFQVSIYARGHQLDATLSVPERLGLAGRCLWFYAGKFCWPHPLLAIYPKWDLATAGVGDILYPAAAGVVWVALFAARGTLGGGAFVAATCFGLALAPMLHVLSQSGFTSYAYVNDHALYVASIAGCALVAAAVGTLAQRSRAWALGARGAAGLVLIGAVVLSHHAARHYRDFETLFEETLIHNPGAWPAHANLGGYYLQRGDAVRAERHFRAALHLHPACPQAYTGLGMLAAAADKPAEAIAGFRAALRFDPDDLMALNNLGLALQTPAQAAESEAILRHAIAVHPQAATAYFNLGGTLMTAERPAEAQDAFQAAVVRDPTHAGAWHNLGTLLRYHGRSAEAAKAFARVLELDPGNAQAAADLADVKTQ